MKDELSPTGCCINILLKRPKPNSPTPKVGNRIDEVPKRAAEPI